MIKQEKLTTAALLLVALGVVIFTVVKTLSSSGLYAHLRQSYARYKLPPVAAGDKAADFSLQDLDGKTVKLSALRGKVVFLNLWATWCRPCRDEMPSMETLYHEFQNHKDFVILAVSQDTEGKKVVVPYVEKNSYHFEIILDPENKVSEAYNVSGIPETFIIGRDGRIIAHHMGAFDWSRSDVKEALMELLDSKEGKGA